VIDVISIARVLSSENRVKILEWLTNGNTKPQIPRSTLYAELKSLTERGLVLKTSKGYKLTHLGLLYYRLYRVFSNNINVLSRILKVFPNHVISIPDEFLFRVERISDFYVVESTTDDILKPHKVILDYLCESKEFYGVFSVGFLDFNLLERFEKAEVIVFRDLANNLSGVKKCVLDYYVLNYDPLIVLIVTDRFMAMGFYKTDGTFDLSRILIATSKSALKFGRNLFNYYKEEAIGDG